MTKIELKIDWASHKAALYACRHWHYSKSIPAGKLVKVGAWEDGKFIGVVIFSRGATVNIGKPYKMDQTEICELTRVALTNHVTPVTRIVAIAIKMLRKQSPGMKLIISYADVDQGHEGKIYQAGNWIYEGLKNAGSRSAFIIHGKKIHPKTIHSKYGKGAQSFAWVKKNLDPNATEFKTAGKHKYLYPLNNETRIMIERMVNPNMRVKHSSDAE